MHDIVVLIPRDCEPVQIEKAAEDLRLYLDENDIKDPKIIVGAGPSMENAELFRMHLMTNIPEISIIIANPKEKSGLTVAEIAETLASNTLVNEEDIEKINKLIRTFRLNPPVVLPEIRYIPPYSHINKKNGRMNKSHVRAIKQFNNINQQNKQYLFNRTKHK